jgi:hypothetical protein
VGNFFLWGKHPLQCCVTPYIHRNCENNVQISNLCIGRAWLIMKTLKWHVLSLWDPLFESPSNLANVIKDQFYQRWKMLTTNLHYARALFNPYLFSEVCLHDDANAKEALNRVLWKTTHTPTTYALALRDFANFVESRRPFFDTPNEGPKVAPTWVVGFNWSWWMHICTHRPLHFGINVFCIIVWT